MTENVLLEHWKTRGLVSSAVGAVVAIFTEAESTLVKHGAVKQEQLIFMVIV